MNNVNLLILSGQTNKHTDKEEPSMNIIDIGSH